MIFDALWKARWDRKQIDRLYEKDIRKARKAKHHEELVHSLGATHWYDRQMATEKISSLDTWRLQEQAEHLGIPFPDFNSQKDLWEKSSTEDAWFLTIQGRQELRRQIREEKSQRRNDMIVWFKDVAVPLTGLLGTLIGVISTMHSCSRK